ncbi:MAG: serine/threonine protein kinase, partial [Acidobacteria bacterium]|nr:serine/threonine protein kinase [Acidobacteriota bacterium]
MIDQIKSRYFITGVIRQGGMGTLYAAEDKVLGRRVAVKILSFERSDEQRAHFRSTVEMMSHIRHPNVASVYDYGETEEGLSYVILERVTGLSVAEMLRVGSLPLNKSVHIAASVAGALRAFHAAGVLHNDIKPSNILVDQSGRVKLADFGITRSVAEEVVERFLGGELVVTGQRRLVADALAHMAPEQVLFGASPNTRTDMFSLGVTIYETLTGKLPFSGKSAEETEDELLYSGRSAAEVVQQLLAANPQRPSLLNPSVPEPLNDIVLKALAKEPEHRFQTADELLAALDPIRGVLRIADESPSEGGDEATATGDAQRGGGPTGQGSPMLYFLLEGERARGDLVECGSDVDLLFDYSI